MKNVIFDLDGTIANTLPLCIKSFQEALEPLVERTLGADEIIATFGPSEEATIAEFLPDRVSEGLNRYLSCYQRLHDQCPYPFDGVIDILHYLKCNNAFIGLVTSKGNESTDITLMHYQIRDFFDVIKTGISTGPIKDIQLEEIIQKHSLDRGNTLYVGDSPIDILASQRCQIYAAAAAWAPTANENELRALQPDCLFTTVNDFFDFLKNHR